MPEFNILRTADIRRTPRVQQVEGIFDLKADEVSREEWTVSMPLEEQEWNVGLIVGASGSGKTTIATEVFGDAVKEFNWKEGESIVDSFPDTMSIKDITYALSSVGFGSPPNWLRPFHVLSTGEQFRANLARAIVSDGLVVLDEFTSVVDRTVAQIGSHSMAKAVRRRGGQFVAVSCHYDIVDWLQPDWLYEPADNQFTWRSVRRRPEVSLSIRRVDKRAWSIFSRFHYLSQSINQSATCFVAFMGETPVAFVGVLSFPHATASGWRLSRTVGLPDYQGLGIGTVMADRVASMMRATGKPVYDRMAHPAMIWTRAKSTNWRMTGKPGRISPVGKSSARPSMKATSASGRVTAGFKYVGRIDYDGARKLSII